MKVLIFFFTSLISLSLGVNVELGPPQNSSYSDDVDYNNNGNDNIEYRREESKPSLLEWLFGRPAVLRRKWRRRRREYDCGCRTCNNGYCRNCGRISPIPPPAPMYQEQQQQPHQQQQQIPTANTAPMPNSFGIKPSYSGITISNGQKRCNEQREKISSSSRYVSPGGVAPSPSPCESQQLGYSTTTNKGFYDAGASDSSRNFKCSSCGKWGHLSGECPLSSGYAARRIEGGSGQQGSSGLLQTSQSQQPSVSSSSFTSSAPSSSYSSYSSFNRTSGSSVNKSGTSSSMLSSSSSSSSMPPSMSGSDSCKSTFASASGSSQMAGVYVDVGLSQDNCQLAASLGEALILNRVQGNAPSNILPPFSIQRLLTALNVTIVSSSLDDFYKKLMENISSDGLELIIRSPDRLVDSIMEAGGISKRQANKISRVLRVAINGYNSMAPDKMPDNVSSDQLKWILASIGKKTSEKILSENCKLK